VTRVAEQVESQAAGMTAPPGSVVLVAVSARTTMLVKGCVGTGSNRTGELGVSDRAERREEEEREFASLGSRNTHGPR